MSKELIGRVPPQARDLEAAILGAIMIDKNAITVVTEILQPECFYVEDHITIYSAMLEMYKDGNLIDHMTVTYKLRDKSQLSQNLSPYFITQLTNSIVSGAHIETHCRIVLEKYIQREVIRMGSELINEAYKDGVNIFELAGKVDTVGNNIQNSLFKKDYTHIEKSVTALYERIEILKSQPNTITGVETGYTTLNTIVHGWQKSDLVILAARPSVGKTSFALNLAKNAAVKGHKVGFFSLEMPNVQLTQRVVSNVGSIWMDNLSTGQNLQAHFYHNAMEAVEKLNIYIDDSASLNIFEFKAKARRMVIKHKVEIIIIDYLQLMSGVEKKGQNREQEISTISRGLKIAAKELNIPIIALSQLSRSIETRGDQKPKLSDLRESGAIEQDADIVGFLYWLEVEGQKKGMLSIAKHRNGQLREIAFDVQNHFQRWTEIGEPEYSVPDNFKPLQKEDNIF